MKPATFRGYFIAFEEEGREVVATVLRPSDSLPIVYEGKRIIGKGKDRKEAWSAAKSELLQYLEAHSW